MPISKEQFKNILGNSRAIIQNQVAEERAAAPSHTRRDDVVTEYRNYKQEQPQSRRAQNRRGGVDLVNTDTELDYTGAFDESGSYSDGGYGYDDSYGNEYDEHQSAGNDIHYNKQTAQGSRMPDAIKEAMLNRPIDTSALDANRSVLDEVGATPKQQKRPQQQAPQINMNQLEEMIEKCISSKLDNALKTIQLGDSKIKLVDASGRVFVANLEYKGNINDKKKK